MQKKFETANTVLLSTLLLFSFSSYLAFENAPSISFFLLFILAVATFLYNKNAIYLSFDDKLIIVTFFLYALTIGGLVIYHNDELRHFEKASRFILILPVMILLVNAKFHAHYLFIGSAIGALIACAIAVYQTQILDYPRAYGFFDKRVSVRFGNISLLLGLISLAGFLLFYHRRNLTYMVLTATCTLCGVTGSLLSGTRGGWIALPILFLFLFHQTRTLFTTKIKLAILIIILFFGFFAVAIPQTNVLTRIQSAQSDLTQYFSGQSKTTSLGARFEMWKASWIIFKKQPLLGAGEINREKIALDLFEQKIVVGEFSKLRTHSHNEILEALSVRGIVGFLALLSIYLIPLSLFLKMLSQDIHNWELRPYAIAGALTILGFIDFGLSNSLLSANITTIFYCFSVTFFWAAAKQIQKKTIR